MTANLADVDWEDVRVFLTLLDSSTFREAADALGVNPSTVARRLDALESTLGTRLFERGRHGIIPTAAADDLAPAARHFRRAEAAFRHAASNLEDRPEGVVTISAATGIANLIVVPLISNLLARHPNLRIELDANNAFSDLDRHEADIAIRPALAGQDVWGGENLIAKRLGAAPVVPVTSAAYAEEIGELADLESVRWVTFGATARHFSWGRLVVNHVSEGSIVLRSDDPNAVFRAAMLGVGVTWMNRMFVDGANIVEVPLAPALEDLREGDESLWLVCHRSLRNVPRVAAVWDYLAETITI